MEAMPPTQPRARRLPAIILVMMGSLAFMRAKSAMSVMIKSPTMLMTENVANTTVAALCGVHRGPVRTPTSLTCAQVKQAKPKYIALQAAVKLRIA